MQYHVDISIRAMHSLLDHQMQPKTLKQCSLAASFCSFRIGYQRLCLCRSYYILGALLVAHYADIQHTIAGLSAHSHRRMADRANRYSSTSIDKTGKPGVPASSLAPHGSKVIAWLKNWLDEMARRFNLPRRGPCLTPSALALKQQGSSVQYKLKGKLGLPLELTS